MMASSRMKYLQCIASSQLCAVCISHPRVSKLWDEQFSHAPQELQDEVSSSNIDFGPPPARSSLCMYFTMDASKDVSTEAR
jgi:hypothetical protein